MSIYVQRLNIFSIRGSLILPFEILTLIQFPGCPVAQSAPASQQHDEFISELERVFSLPGSTAARIYRGYATGGRRSDGSEIGLRSNDNEGDR